MSYEIEKIKQALVNALESLELDPQAIDEATFHLTDWLDDLKRWNSFCENPESLKSDEIGGLLMKFLVHVPAHIAAACKIVTGLPVSDVFDIGATSEKKT